MSGDQLSDDCSNAALMQETAFVSRKSPAKHQWRLIKSCPTLDSSLPNSDLSLQRILSLITPESELIDDAGGLVSTETKQRWIAEAQFMRAFYYYDLATIFQNIPLIDKPMEVVDKSTITKSSKEEVMNFILKDLNTAIAEPNLPNAKSLPTSEIGRITKEAAMAFRARGIEVLRQLRRGSERPEDSCRIRKL